MIQTAVVIPSKDNIGTIADVVARSLVHCERVYVVDDGCVDGTGAAAEAAGAIVLTHRRREGVRKQKIAEQVGRRPEDTIEVRKVPTGQGI